MENPLIMWEADDHFGGESVHYPVTALHLPIASLANPITTTAFTKVEVVASPESVVFVEQQPIDSNQLLDALEQEFFFSDKEKKQVTSFSGHHQSQSTEPATDNTVASSPTGDNNKSPPIETPGLYDSQFNLDGMPTAYPFPVDSLPVRSPLQSMVSEFAYPRQIDNDALSRQMLDTPLAQLPESYQAMDAPEVPQVLVEHGIAFLVYTATRKKTEQTVSSAASSKALEFYRQFGVHIRNDAEDGGALISWKTLFYVVDFMRRFPTAACYIIEDQPFVEFAGVDKEYDFENWHAREDHAMRLFAIALCTGDSESAVCQLDRLLRFKRSMGRASHCITLGNKALVFADYAIDEEGKRVHTAWIDLSLNDDVVHGLLKTRHTNEEYYDGPYCETCRAHHCPKPLLYCTKCSVVQYCSLKCRKQDNRKHKKLCQHNRK